MINMIWRASVPTSRRNEQWRASVLTSRLPPCGRIVSGSIAERREGQASACPAAVTPPHQKSLRLRVSVLKKRSTLNVLRAGTPALPTAHTQNTRPTRITLVTNRLRVSLVLLASSLLLAGCLSGSRQAQREALTQKRTFVPLAGPAKPLSPASRAAAVKVRAFRAQPPFDARHFIVRRPGGEFAADYYNGWLAAPHELIRVQATRYIEASGVFEAVYDSASGTVAPLGLEGLVTELYLDHTGDTPTAVVALRLLVLDERAPSFTVLATHEAQARVAYTPGTPSAASEAFGQALTQVLEELATALSTSKLSVAER